MQLLDLAGPDMNPRILTLFGEITVESVEHLVQTIYTVNHDDRHIDPDLREPINIYINSPGGELAAGLSVITAIESSDTPVHVHAIGEVFSCALFIFIVGHKRYAYKHSDFMFHAISAGVAGSVEEIRKNVRRIEASQRKYEDIFKVYTKIPHDKVKEIVETDSDWYFEYLEAYDLGVADYIEISERYEEDCALIKEKYPEPEEELIPDEEFLKAIPRDKLIELYKKHAEP